MLIYYGIEIFFTTMYTQYLILLGIHTKCRRPLKNEFQ